jgi:hypothetical protein
MTSSMFSVLLSSRSLGYFAGTTVGCIVIAIFIIAKTPQAHPLGVLLYSLSVGLITCAFCMLAVPKVRQSSTTPTQAMLWMGAASVAGTVIGTQVGSSILLLGFGIREDARSLFSSIWISLAAGAGGSLYFYSRDRLKFAKSELEAQTWKATAAQRLATEAQLKALQAQLEPHFLFNTLAHVSSAIEEDPATARRMIDDLVGYLRTSLYQARAIRVSLREEFDLNIQLLRIMKHRMGERLQWRFELPPELASLCLAPMLVQPLIENAVKHGLEPATQGGTITVTAATQGDHLLIAIEDDGQGLFLAADTGNGAGLANVRERLRSLYGEQASLRLESHDRRTVASLSIPLLALEAQP